MQTASKARTARSIGDSFKVKGNTKSNVQGDAKATIKSKTKYLRESAINQSNAISKTQVARPLAPKPLSVTKDVASKHKSVAWTPTSESHSRNPRHIARSIKYEVWHRDGGRCTNCGSSSNINFDHIRPVALGGGSEIDNLRLLCFNCNQRQAIRSFGLATLERFLG